MRVSDAGIERIKAREGVVATMYRDQAGLPTIGVGHLLTRDELASGKLWLPTGAVDWHVGLSDEQVVELLEQDLDNAEAAVDRAMPDVENLSQAQFDALVSFVFNVGTHAFRDSTLRKRILGGQLHEVPTQLRRWVWAAGRIDPVLAKRREDEIAQWEGA